MLELGAARLARDEVGGRRAGSASGPWHRPARSGRGTSTRGRSRRRSAPGRGSCRAACWRITSSWRSGSVISLIASSTSGRSARARRPRAAARADQQHQPPCGRDGPPASARTRAACGRDAATARSVPSCRPPALAARVEHLANRSLEVGRATRRCGSRSRHAAAFSSWVSWREPRGPRRPRGRAPPARSLVQLPRRPRPRLWHRSRSPSPPRTAAAPRPRRPRRRAVALQLCSRQAAVRAPTQRKQLVCSSQASSSGARTRSPATASRSTSPSRDHLVAPALDAAGRCTSSVPSSSCTTASLESTAAPRRSQAASASDLPEPMPPVKPTNSNGLGLLLGGRLWLAASAGSARPRPLPPARRRAPRPPASSAGASSTGGALGDRLLVRRRLSATRLPRRRLGVGDLARQARRPRSDGRGRGTSPACSSPSGRRHWCRSGSTWPSTRFKLSDRRRRSSSISRILTFTVVAGVDDLARVLDVVLGKLGDVDEALDALHDLDERAEVDDLGDLALEHVTDVVGAARPAATDPPESA